LLCTFYRYITLVWDWKKFQTGTHHVTVLELKNPEEETLNFQDINVTASYFSVQFLSENTTMCVYDLSCTGGLLSTKKGEKSTGGFSFKIYSFFIIDYTYNHLPGQSSQDERDTVEGNIYWRRRSQIEGMAEFKFGANLNKVFGKSLPYSQSNFCHSNGAC